MNELVCARLGLLDAKQDGYVLDGYPHTVAQVHFLNDRGLIPDKVRALSHHAAAPSVCIYRYSQQTLICVQYFVNTFLFWGSITFRS